MLEQRELVPLLTVLNSGNVPLDQVATNFSRAFGKSEHFKIGQQGKEKGTDIGTGRKDRGG